jgi:hypothetical protein
LPVDLPSSFFFGAAARSPLPLPLSSALELFGLGAFLVGLEQ